MKCRRLFAWKLVTALFAMGGANDAARERAPRESARQALFGEVTERRRGALASVAACGRLLGCRNDPERGRCVVGAGDATLEEALRAGQRCAQCSPTLVGTTGCSECICGRFEQIRIKRNNETMQCVKLSMNIILLAETAIITNHCAQTGICAVASTSAESSDRHCL